MIKKEYQTPMVICYESLNSITAGDVAISGQIG